MAFAAVASLAGCAVETPDGAGISGAGAVGGAAGAAGVAGAVGAIPCDVQTVVAARCQNCHAASPILGAPMALVTLNDFQRPYMVASTLQLAGQTMTVAQLARIRINQEMGTAPMPQGAPLAPNDLTALNTWLAGGAQAGLACPSMTGGVGGNAGTTVSPMAGVGGATAMGGVGGDPGGTGGSAGVGGAGAGGAPTPTTGECPPDAYEPLVPRVGETCYEFQTHGLSSPTDTTKFNVPNNETYNQFYFDVPWPAGMVGTRFGADFDNIGVLHHWLAFETDEDMPAGSVSTNVSGTTLGTNARLFGGWASGGCNIVFPDEMGMQLAAPGKKIMIQWHHYNFTGMPQPDGSKVQICTVPASERANIGSMTWLGTENFNSIFGMPPGVESKFSGTCLNETSAPITIINLWPHMHNIGTNMYTEVQRAAGGVDIVFDKPFQNDHQVHYDMNPPIVLQPGDKIKAECTFFNDTSAAVAFGQSTDAEMCYQFAYSYPAGALDKPSNPSLIGATNTCWGDD